MSIPEHVRPRGLDHDWFDHRTIREYAGLRLPAGKRVVLLTQVPIEFFPLDAPAQPFRPSGALDRPYPDTWGYANRDYGNRAGIYRLVRVFEQTGARPTAFVDAASAEHYPHAMRVISEAAWEFAASGIDRGTLHFGEIAAEQEARMIADAIDAIRKVSAQPIAGWQSPGQSESRRTLELLAAAGIRYVADWVNDEFPYVMRTPRGPLIAVPASFELSDRNMLVHRDFTADEYESQVVTAAERLLREASAESPRVLSLTISPWVCGYPHRVRNLTRALARILGDPSVIPMTCAELAAAFEPQTA